VRTRRCDGDGVHDALENQLAERWFPNVRMSFGECGRAFLLTNQPVLFRARYLSYGGIVDQDWMAINYTILYSGDCGPPGPVSHFFSLIDLIVPSSRRVLIRTTQNQLCGSGIKNTAIL
jgi:hypothetical protein